MSHAKNVPIPSELNEQDEYYTPCYAVFPIAKHLTNFKRIWCPFDTVQSNFVKVLQRRGHEVVHSHISEGVDFFSADVPEGIDAIVSNPPYSKKTEVLRRLFEIGKPFAMLLGCLGIFEASRFRMFAQHGVEIMVFDKRISYLTSFDGTGGKAQPPFSSWYICKGILPQQIVFENLRRTDDNNPEEITQGDLFK